MMIVEQMLNNAPKPLLHIADVSGSALFQGDCLDIMPLIPDKSVQLILADLPYGTTACKWDSIIDLNLLWKQYKRIIKDNGAIVLTASQPFTTKLISSNYEMFKYELIWEKSRASNIFFRNTQPLKYHENILVFSLAGAHNMSIEKMLYNPKMQERDKKNIRTAKSYKTSGNTIFGDERTFISSIDNDRRSSSNIYPKSIIKIGSMSNFKNTERQHPTQKPLELMKYLILTYSNENDMVLDNTMGVGTTCLGAKELNRSFIGIEKEVKYYELAVARVFG